MRGTNSSIANPSKKGENSTEFSQALWQFKLLKALLLGCILGRESEPLPLVLNGTRLGVRQDWEKMLTYEAPRMNPPGTTKKPAFTREQVMTMLEQMQFNLDTFMFASPSKARQPSQSLTECTENGNKRAGVSLGSRDTTESECSSGQSKDSLPGSLMDFIEEDGLGSVPPLAELEERVEDLEAKRKRKQLKRLREAQKTPTAPSKKRGTSQ